MGLTCGKRYIPCLDLSVPFIDLEMGIGFFVRCPWIKEDVCGKNKKERGGLFCIHGFAISFLTKLWLCQRMSTLVLGVAGYELDTIVVRITRARFGILGPKYVWLVAWLKSLPRTRGYMSGLKEGYCVEKWRKAHQKSKVVFEKNVHYPGKANGIISNDP